MEVVAALFVVALYKATEKIWEKGFDAAWTPVDEALKARFTRWAGRDKESQRRAAFIRAAEIARANTLRYAANPREAERILDALNGERDRRGAEALAEEATKLMLFSAVPDVPRLTELCHHILRFEALFAGETPPPPETVATVLSDFLTNLREALLDQEPYHDLIQREMLRAMREVVAELRPVAYDNEATYCYQMAEMYRQLEFVGIPELRERRPITVEDIFIHLRAERQIEAIPDWELEEQIRDAIARRDAHQLVALQVRQREGSVGRKVTPEERQQWSEEIKAAIEARDALAVVKLQRRLERTAPFVTEVSIEESLKQADQMVILGDPGAGKTTLLKYLTVICAEGRAEAELGLKANGAGSPLPVFIPLREFATECAGRDQDYCLLDYLYTHAREHLILNLPRGFFEDALEAGRCLVCLDGLDEVWAVGQRKVVCDAVKALAARFPRNRYLVTSRIVGYDEAPLDRRDFIHHTILPLEDDDIREFVHRWYDVRERDPVQRKRKVGDLIATIEREPRIKSLATNPLLLTIIALVHRIEAELPHERVKLYDKCVTALVDTWEEVKGLTIAERQRPFYRYRRRLLERLAYELHTQAAPLGPPADGGKTAQLQTVKEGDLELLLTRFLMENRRLGLADDPDGARDEARAFIRLARGRTGLLVERGEGVFGFPHMTFQEYLAACDVENRCIHRGVDALWEEIEPRLHDPHWREVILLLLGSLNKYDEPPTLLVERILEAGEGDKLEPVLHRHLYLAARALADRVDVADGLHRQVADALFEAAGTAPPWERGDAFIALSWLEGDCYAAGGLLSLARDSEVEAGVRRNAAWALGHLGHVEDKVIGSLLDLACDLQAEAGVRRAAARALGRLGHAEEAEDILLALARGPQVETQVRCDAAFALGQLGRCEQATEILLALARDSQVEANKRLNAAFALGQLGQHEEAAEIMLVLAHDYQADDHLVRCDAISNLGQMGWVAEQVLDGLLALARDPEASAKTREVGRMRERGLLTWDEWFTKSYFATWEQRTAINALGNLIHAGKVPEILLTLARDPQVGDLVRSDAARTLGQVGLAEENLLDRLLVLAHDSQVRDLVRSAAAQALGQLGRTEEAMEILLPLAHDLQVWARVRRNAASTLGQLGRAEEAAEALLALARDEKVDASVRREAAESLGQMRWADKRVLDGLLTLARDPHVGTEVRSAAASALGRLDRAEEAGEVLLRLARHPQMDAWMRRDAVEALGQLGRAEDKVLDGLLVLARDPQVEDVVRYTAYDSLKRLVGSAVD